MKSRTLMDRIIVSVLNPNGKATGLGNTRSGGLGWSQSEFVGFR
jgi:hypothetical protein